MCIWLRDMQQEWCMWPLHQTQLHTDIFEACAVQDKSEALGLIRIQMQCLVVAKSARPKALNAGLGRGANTEVAHSRDVLVVACNLTPA